MTYMDLHYSILIGSVLLLLISVLWLIWFSSN